jgi:anti-sigma factor ChrR (cupin superfamily)
MDSPRTEPQHFPALLPTGWQEMAFSAFREGVEICVLRDADPKVALLRYAPGASVPRHVHTGLETILVLEGTQSDERGDYPAGALVLNPEGTVHSVWSEPGCVVLIQWERPVRFVDDGAPG